MTVGLEQHHADTDRGREPWELTRLESLHEAQTLAARYGGIEDELAALEETGAGGCDDCGRAAGQRYGLGRYVLCRRCATSRVRAGKQL